MTPQEISEQFDILYNNINSNKAPGLTEEEKEVFLNKAQEELVRGLYNGSIKQEGFEETEELKRYLNKLISTQVYNLDVSIPEDRLPLVDASNFQSGLLSPFNYKGYTYYFSPPPGYLYRVYEEVDLHNDNTKCGATINGVEVTPIDYEDLHVVLKNPFKKPSKKRVIRVDLGANSIEQTAILSKYKVAMYRLTYVRKPKKIVLVDPNPMVGRDNTTSGDLDSSLHSLIVDMAVKLAKSTWA